MRSLETLRLDKCDLADESSGALRTMVGLKSLQIMNNPRLTDAWIAGLKRANSRLHLYDGRRPPGGVRF